MKTRTGGVTSLNRKNQKILHCKTQRCSPVFLLQRALPCASLPESTFTVFSGSRKDLVSLCDFGHVVQVGYELHLRGAVLSSSWRSERAAVVRYGQAHGARSPGDYTSFPALLFKRALIFSEKRPLVCSSVRPICFDLSLRNRMMRDKSSKYKKKLNMQRMYHILISDENSLRLLLL